MELLNPEFSTPNFIPDKSKFYRVSKHHIRDGFTYLMALVMSGDYRVEEFEKIRNKEDFDHYVLRGSYLINDLALSEYKNSGTGKKIVDLLLKTDSYSMFKCTYPCCCCRIKESKEETYRCDNLKECKNYSCSECLVLPDNIYSMFHFCIDCAEKYSEKCNGCNNMIIVSDTKVKISCIICGIDKRYCNDCIMIPYKNDTRYNSYILNYFKHNKVVSSRVFNDFNGKFHKEICETCNVKLMNENMEYITKTHLNTVFIKDLTNLIYDYIKV